MPTKEADFTNWLNNFSTLIAANPPAYGLMSTDAANIAAQNAAWTAVYGPITSPATKTAQAVQHKNTAKVSVTAQIRTYAQSIANNPGVTSANKIALGLNPKTSTPAPVTPPTTFPALTLQSQAPLTAVLRYRDSAASPSVKAKPYGVTQCQIFGMASATPVSDQSKLPMIATPTKSPFTLNLNPADTGKQFYAAARWAIRTGEFGPWSPIIQFTVTNG
jgi:hypothetical protein